MPGTIHFSVPEFKDLPSSIPSSSMLTKVTMGKREHQTRDKGDFSFPVTNLRNDVTITIQDAEGNEMSQTVVPIMSVVERGSWDEFISLEGGGNVHMRLKFVLSEEERNRVRSVRESALKKKNGELLSESRIVPSSSGISQEVSDSKRSVSHSQALSVGDPPIRTEDGGTSFDERRIKPNDIDGSKETSLAASTSRSPGPDLGDVNRKSQQNIETKLQQVDLPKRTGLLQEPTFATKKSLVSSKVKMFQAGQPEKEDTHWRTPSNVRKMTSAFESSLAKDSRPGVKPPPAVKSQSKDPKLDYLNRLRKTTSETLKKPSQSGESQLIQTLDTQGVSGEKLESAALYENQDFPCESSGAWIFPDFARRLCITTGSTEVVTCLVDGVGIQERTPEARKSFSSPEHVEKPKFQPGYCNAVNNGDEISDQLRTTQLDNSAEVEPSNGPLGQAVKVAIMAAFGLLVLLTRQRNHRYLRTFSSNPFLSNGCK